MLDCCPAFIEQNSGSRRRLRDEAECIEAGAVENKRGIRAPGGGGGGYDLYLRAPGQLCTEGPPQPVYSSHSVV